MDLVLNNMCEDEQFFKKILNLMPVPIIVTDTDKAHILFANKKFIEIYEYTVEQLKDISTLQLYAIKEDRENLIKKLNKDENVHIKYIKSVKADGTIFPVEIYVQKTIINNNAIAILEIIDITEKIEAEKILERYATIDEMTGFYNRRTGLEILEKEFKNCLLEKCNLTVGFLDIDKLKMVNDLYGHREGDYLIKTIAQIIKQTIGKEDFVCRIGGDEFLIIFVKCDLQKSQQMCNDVLESINEFNGRKIKEYNICISYGLADMSELLSNCVDDLINLADNRMYTEKKAKCKCNNKSHENK